MPWPVVSSRDVYENPWIRVREDTVERPFGGRGFYGVMSLRRPAVLVVALTNDDEVLLVDVDRHTVGPSLEVPAGGTDGEEPLLAARRELLEETGHRAEHWQPLGCLQALNGVCEETSTSSSRAVSRSPARTGTSSGSRASPPYAGCRFRRSS